VRVCAVVVLAVATVGWVIHIRADKPAANVSTKTKTAASTKKTDTSNTITFIATGDMLPHDSVDSNAKKADGSYDFTPFFGQVHSYLTAADMSFCNQESPSDPSKPVSGYPTFNAPLAFAQALSHEGCNVINLANNHADDKGQAGIDATRQVWAGLPTLAVAGTSSTAAEQQQVSYFTVKGVKFAFLSYAQCSNDKSVSSYGLNVFSETLAGAQIAEAKQQHADMIIAAMHSCDEDQSTEDSWQDQTARYFADQGVNIVVGTGPHWLQPAQRLPRTGGGTTAVWYSLGNFLGTQLDINGLIGGIAAMKIDVKTKTVTDMGFMPTYIHYEWTAAQKAADDEAARHNIMVYPLDLAAQPMANSQDNTTVEAQTTRVTQLMTGRTPVTMLTSKTFSSFLKK
jgi:poly-gamma-glutamate synthesis protein (capsule biosynthesis protein)